jgi:uncharacterized membrane protein YcaP (DUF421 family)
MEKQDIHFTDLNRWLFGQTPPVFMIETLIRTLLVYVLLLMVVRLMGKRMAGQITLTELAVMITLGAIVSPVMQLPDRGLLFAVVVLGCTLFFQRQFNLWTFTSEKIEKITEGEMSLLVEDGALKMEELQRTRITRQQIFAVLREKKIQNLGQVERMYLEACGVFSIYERKEPNPGLPVTPPYDTRILSLQHASDGGSQVCRVCGHVQKTCFKQIPCELCHACEWSNAYVIADKANQVRYETK